jgi:hypothetical protein
LQRQNRQKYNTINGSPSRRASRDSRPTLASAPVPAKGEEGKEEGEICEEDPVRRSYRRRQERLADRAKSEADEAERRRRRQRSVSKDCRDEGWARDKRSAPPSGRFREVSKPRDLPRRELSPIRTQRGSDRLGAEKKPAHNPAIDNIKQANEQLALEIEQLQLLKAQQELKKELQKLKEEVNQPVKTLAPLRLPRSSSLSVDCRPPSTSDMASSHQYEPLSPASFLEDVSRSCLSAQTDSQFVLSRNLNGSSISPPMANESYLPLSAPLQQPRDSYKLPYEVSISEDDLNNLRHIRQQLYSNRQKQTSL